jgi:hypothetical protein
MVLITAWLESGSGSKRLDSSPSHQENARIIKAKQKWTGSFHVTPDKRFTILLIPVILTSHAHAVLLNITTQQQTHVVLLKRFAALGKSQFSMRK